MSSIFAVRYGKHGEIEDDNIAQGIVSMGWDELPNLSELGLKSELQSIYRTIHPSDPPGMVNTNIQQIWCFLRDIQIDDHIALPMRTRKGVALGRVKSDYRFDEGNRQSRHQREVEWMMIVPRTSSSEVHYSH
jgi:restriction system protein